MSLGLRRRFSVIALTALVALIATMVAPEPAASGETAPAWLTAGRDPVRLHDAIEDNSYKLPGEFASRLKHAEDGILRVMVATGERTPRVEDFVAGNTSWVKWYFDNPRFYAGVTPDQLAALLESPAIRFVEPDVPLTYFLSSSTLDIHARSNGTDAAGVWSYDKSGGGTGALRSDVPGLTVDQATGKGVTVAITDSGIDRTHRDFGGWDCTPAPYQPCDSRILKAVTTDHIIGTGIEPGDSLPTTEAASGHGTHVAGIVGGNGYYTRSGVAPNPATYGGDGVPIGVAPQSNLIMTKNGDTIWAGLSNFGLEWQLENAATYNIKVSSNSWGCLGGCNFNGSSATGQLFKDMYDAGIVVTFAVGNDGGSDNGASFSGNAQSPYVLGVASYDDTNHRLASTSSRGSDKTLPDPTTWSPASEPVNGERRPDVAAPGVGIWAARTLTGGAASGAPRVTTSDAIGGGTNGYQPYVSMSGTSMATPHVSGAAALAFSACPTATPLDVMRAVMATAGSDILKSTGAGTAEAFEVGYGGLEVRAAVDWLLDRDCDSRNAGTGTEPEPDPSPTPTETATPEPTPTEEPPVQGGTRYYFHSTNVVGNLGGTTFDTKLPEWDAPSYAFDPPVIGNGAPKAVWDPYWSGTVSEKISSFTLDIWAKTPVGDLLGEVNYVPTIWVGSTPYKLPTLTQAIDPQIGDAPTRLTKTYTTMLDAAGNEIPLSVDPAGQEVTITIAGRYLDEEAGSWISYDSKENASGFVVNGSGSGEPDPTPTETTDPDPTPTEEPTPTGRGTYPANPNDPLFENQWGMTKINAPQAWQETHATGFGINIAVVDSGLDLGHPDFDCPGKVTVVPGSNISVDDTPQDDDGHGTHVAGIAGACTNNDEGVVGVAPDATIMPVRVFGESDLDKAMADGIRLATDNGAHVINLSIGDIPPFSHLGADLFPQTEEAMEHARDNGVVIAAAAGNFDQPTCEYPSRSRNVICVVATDRDDMRSYYTDFPVNVDPNSDEPGLEPVVAAPGGQGTFCEEGIVSTYLRTEESVCYTTGYESLDGTSMSSPHVAGLAALLYDRIGGQRNRANADLIVQTILDSAEDLYTPGWDPIVGHGRIDALAAVTALPEPEVTPTEEPAPSDTSVIFTDNNAESGTHSDAAKLEAVLTDDATGLPIQGADLEFELAGADGSRTFTATTDATGTASDTIKLDEKPAQYLLTVRYEGEPDTYSGSAETASFVVDKEESASALTSSGQGANRTLTATLTDHDDEAAGLSDRLITFMLDGEELGSARTDDGGAATFDVPPRYAGTGGPRDYTATFGGDEFYTGSSATTK